MTKTKSSKRALLMSALALLMCVSMLIGSTYAWFTDSVTSAGNVIQSGTLKVLLLDADGNNLEGETFEWVTADGRAQDQILWEPGCTYKTKEFYVKNNGNLALKYEIAINGIVGDAKLLEAIEWSVTAGEEEATLSGWLKPDESSKKMVLTGHMKEEAGNEYQGLTVEGISIAVFATQQTYENDSFNDQYDAEATFLNQDADGNWLINTVGDLLYFAKHVNSGHTYKNEKILLTADLNLSGMNWTPIGISGANFMGTFDGQNHTVSNFKVDVKKNAGLFGITHGGEIKNLTVKNATVKAEDYAGPLLGSGLTAVTNCHTVDCEVTVTPFLKADGVTYDGGAKAGGLIGRTWEVSSFAISNCTVTNVKVAGYRDLGGLLGMAYNQNVIENCKVSDSEVAYLYLEPNQAYDENTPNENIDEIVGRPREATLRGNTYENVILKTKESTQMGDSDINTTLPADVADQLPEYVELVSTEPIFDEVNKTITIESIEFKDQDGNVVDMEGNTTPFTVTIDVPFDDGEMLDIYHDGELVDTATVTDGKVSYECLHFCEVTAYGVTYTTVSTADELVAALEKGENVIFKNDIKIDPASMSNAYGTTGINVKKGQIINGNGFTLNIKGAGGTWDSGINTTGGAIKNLTVTGSFRGIFVNHNSDYSETVVLEKVTLEGVTYTVSCDQGLYQNLKATGCTIKGWTSFAATIGTATFTNCDFMEGNGYAYCRPYAPTTFVGCDFAEGYQLDARAAVTFENCTINGVALTAENLGTLVTSNIANATVK